jgi:hypothetical protein
MEFTDNPGAKPIAVSGAKIPAPVTGWLAHPRVSGSLAASPAEYRSALARRAPEFGEPPSCLTHLQRQPMECWVRAIPVYTAGLEAYRIARCGARTSAMAMESSEASQNCEAVLEANPGFDRPHSPRLSVARVTRKDDLQPDCDRVRPIVRS